MSRERDLPVWLVMLLLMLCFLVVGYVDAVLPDVTEQVQP